MADIFDLVVIGAGPGGYIAAIESAKKGMKTALVENRELGGTCLNRGCIPIKTIMHSTELFAELKACEHLGIHVGETSYNMEEIQKRKEEVSGQLRNGIVMLMKKNKIAVYEGTGSITSLHEVTVQGEETKVLEADKILIATGSVPAMPPIPGIELPNVVNSDALLDKKEVYPRLAIIGGGVIGMEFASIYSALGCQVTVIEALDRILANMDKEIAQNLKMILKKHNVDIHTKAKVEEITEGTDGALICRYTEKEALQEVEVDGILVAVGRRANTEGLLGEGIELSMERGRILVNENYQTNYPNIYAIGDVIGGVQLAHVASAEGINAVAHMMNEKFPINMCAIPGCVYTNPEIATVGQSKEEAEAAGFKVTTHKYAMSANGKSVLSDQERGFIKVVAEAESGKILGAQMMCARATDMISEFGTAIVGGMTLAEMRSVIRPHPTFSEGITEAVSV
ncbi:MAG: dihydrolipoyl dehydrogenase [Lachnospiraceae bacterium]|nr:dihydrolipoyl dehydrogenase [Lachnospiraceae bacterium]